jgi:hypothetical protein
VRIPDAHILKVLNVVAEVVRTTATFLHVNVLLNVIIPHVTNTFVQVLCFCWSCISIYSHQSSLIYVL